MSKLVLGIDSSLACPAFAVLHVKGGQAEVLEVSHIKTNSKRSVGYRLHQIHLHLVDILERYDFDSIVIEKGFNRFAVATQQIQRTVGIILFTLYRNDIERIYEISPTSVKKVVSGSGKASKEELAKSLISYVGDIKYKTNDESDAVAVALSYCINEGWLVEIH